MWINMCCSDNQTGSKSEAIFKAVSSCVLQAILRDRSNRFLRAWAGGAC